MKLTPTLQSIFLVGSSTMIAGVINYLYYPFMLQFMSMETFGEFSSMLGIFNILGVLTAGIGIFLVPKVAKAQKSETDELFSRGWRRVGLIGLVCFAVFLCGLPVVQGYLQLEYWLPLLLVGISLLYAFPSTLLSAFVQGKEAFKMLSGASILSSLLKFMVGVGLAYVGYGVYAAIGGLLFGGIVSFVLLLWYVKTQILSRNFSFFSPQDETSRQFTREFLVEKGLVMQTLGLAVILAMFMNGDVILVRNLFDEQTAGVYGAIAVVGKFIIFLAAAIETVYYPKISQAFHAAQPFSYLLKNATGMLMLALIGAVAGAWLFGPWVLKIMKPELVEHSSLLILVVVMASLYGLLSLYAKVLLVLKDRWTLRLLGAGGGAILLLLYGLPIASLWSYVGVIAGGELLIILLLAWRWYRFSLSVHQDI